MKLLEIAQFWLENGYATIPIRYYSKRPLIDWLEYQNKLPTEFELLQWFPSEMRNIGLVTGNGLVVIDFDIQEVFDYWYSLFPIKTYMVKTKRGVHVYLKTQEPAKNCHTDLLDVKAERGYVLIPPSTHPSGYQYQILAPPPILSIEKLEDVLPKCFTPEPEKVLVERVVTQYQRGNDAWEIADNAVDIDLSLISEIRSRISILDILAGAEPSSRDDRWYVALCPFHEDHTPSFWIDTQRGLCGCRKCNIKEMDVINLFSRINKIDNRSAIFNLATRLSG